MPNVGGLRAGAGRKRKDSVRLEFFVARPVFDLLVEMEREQGVYRTRLASRLLSEQLLGPSSGEGLIGGIVKH